MKPYLKKNVKNLLKKHHLQPSKKLGQNFLLDKITLAKVMQSTKINPRDVVVEIGPGLGAITKEIAKKARKVIAIEKDKKITEALGEILKTFENIKIIHGDILKIPDIQLLFPGNLPVAKYKVVANLPFYISAPVIRQFLEAKNQPESMVLIVQKEVAQRIVARPPKMNLLALSVQFYAKARIVSYVSKKSFWPQPKVDSAILKISSLSRHKESALCQRFFKVVRAGFCHPRKQLANNLSKVLKLEKKTVKSWLLKSKIGPDQRAENLSIKEWEFLAKNLISALVL